jgi:hypothetical protein
VSAALSGFLAGFMEGEASFGIARQSGRDNHKCAVSVTARDDDAALIRVLAASTALGTVRATPARAGAHGQVVWHIRAKPDCLRLAELLDAYPLRGRKSRDYAIWRAALRWWVAGDPTWRLSNRDWTPMVYLKNELQESKKFSPAEASREIRDRGDSLEPDWADFISGLVTAEGCLGIYANGVGLLPKAQLRMRSDDRPLLREVCARTVVGRIYEESRVYPGRAPACSWIVCARDDLSKLVHLLDRHPVRGRKQREYGLWREAVFEYAKGTPPRQRNGRLSELRAALADVRAYSPPPG